MRLIDADVVVKDIADLMLSPWFCAKEGFHWRKEAVEIVRDLCVIKTPTVEAEPVRHGKWIVRIGAYHEEVIDCSVCGDSAWSLVPYENLVRSFKYCPNCGARMDERREE